MAELRLRPDAADWREVDGQVVGLLADSFSHVTINASGAVLWRALDRGASRDELVGALVATYPLDRAQAERDVDAFIAGLRKRGLLVEWALLPRREVADRFDRWAPQRMRASRLHDRSSEEEQ
jgi:hypothetical protein